MLVRINKRSSFLDQIVACTSILQDDKFVRMGVSFSCITKDELFVAAFYNVYLRQEHITSKRSKPLGNSREAKWDQNAVKMKVINTESKWKVK